MVLLGLSSYYGRQVYEAFPGLTKAIPWLGIISLLFMGVLCFHMRRQVVEMEVEPFYRGGLFWLVGMTLTVPVVAIVVSESIMVTPAERMHVVKYGWLGVCLFYGINFSLVRWRVLVALIGGLLTGAAEEGFQYFLPHRVGDINDVIVDGACSGAGVILALLSLAWLTLSNKGTQIKGQQ